MNTIQILITNISANIIYLAIPLILSAVVISAVYLDKKSIPVILVALFAGIIFGKDGLKFWEFNDMIFANNLANLALVFILFHAGFTTNKSSLKLVALPAIGFGYMGRSNNVRRCFSVPAFYFGLGQEPFYFTVRHNSFNRCGGNIFN